MAQPTKPINPRGEKKPILPASSYSFSKINYQLMVIGLVIIAIGFILMSGSDDIFNSMKMTVAPIVVIIGFAFEIYAILKRPAGE